jgi:hypothetical protein
MSWRRFGPHLLAHRNSEDVISPIDATRTPVTLDLRTVTGWRLQRSSTDRAERQSLPDRFTHPPAGRIPSDAAAATVVRLVLAAIVEMDRSTLERGEAMGRKLRWAGAAAFLFLATSRAPADDAFQLCFHHCNPCEATSCYGADPCEPRCGPVRRLLRRVFHRCPPPPCAPVTSCCPPACLPATPAPTPFVSPAPSAPAPRLLSPSPGDVAPPPAFPSARGGRLDLPPGPPVHLERLASFERERPRDDGR